MTDRPAVFQADYTGFQYMRGLKVCRLTFEVPYELGEKVHAILGQPPAGGDQVQVAIARLAQVGAPSGAEEAPQNKRSWADMSRSQRAAVKLTDKDFKAWLVDHYWTGKEEVGDYDGLLKRVLGITSKRELDVDGPKAVAFDQMLASFDYRGRA